MIYTVGPCSQEDLAVLLRAGSSRNRSHHQERFAWQQAGDAVYLLAWRDGELRGRCTLLRQSRYEDVRRRLGAVAEINALEAYPTGQGAGTALLAAAEDRARRDGFARLGLAVVLENVRARALYERRGFAAWGGGTVIDRWTERDEEHGRVIQHADRCHYLVKNLVPGPPQPQNA